MTMYLICLMSFSHYCSITPAKQCWVHCLWENLIWVYSGAEWLCENTNTTTMWNEMDETNRDHFTSAQHQVKMGNMNLTVFISYFCTIQGKNILKDTIVLVDTNRWQVKSLQMIVRSFPFLSLSLHFFSSLPQHSNVSDLFSLFRWFLHAFISSEYLCPANHYVCHLLHRQGIAYVTGPPWTQTLLPIHLSLPFRFLRLSAISPQSSCHWKT